MAENKADEDQSLHRTEDLISLGNYLLSQPRHLIKQVTILVPSIACFFVMVSRR